MYGIIKHNGECGEAHFRECVLFDGELVKVVIADTTIGRVAEPVGFSGVFYRKHYP